MSFIHSWRLSWLLAVYLVQMSFDHFMLYVLFSLTEYRCDFMTLFGIYYTLQSTVTVFRNMFTGTLADAIGLNVHNALKVCVTFQVLLQITMVTLAFGHPWPLIGVQLTLGVVNQLSQSCIYKIIKLHLQLSFPDDVGVQSRHINVMQNFGEAIGTLFLVAATLAGYLFSVHRLPYISLAWLTAGISIAFTSTTLLVAVSIRSSFISRSTLDRPSVNDSDERRSLGEGNGEAAALFEQTRNASLLRRAATYLKNGFMTIWSNPILWYSTSLYFIHFTYQFIAYVPLTLDAAAESTPSAVVPDYGNFCNGLLANLFQEGYVLNAIFMIGSALYALVIVRTEPLRFFRYVFPFVSAVLAVASWLLVANVSSLGTSIVVGVLVYLSFAMNFYCQNLGLAAVPAGFVGFYNSYLGVLGALFLFIPAAFTQANVNVTVVLATGSAMLLGAAVISVWFAQKHASTLRDASLNKY